LIGYPQIEKHMYAMSDPPVFKFNPLKQTRHGAIGATRDAESAVKLFDRYGKERLAFAVALGDLSRHRNCLPILEEHRAVPLLLALLPDGLLGVQTAASQALGHLCRHSKEVAEVALASGTVPELTKRMAAPRPDDPIKRREQGTLRRAGTFLLRSIAEHGPDVARGAAAAGALAAAVACLGPGDAGAKEGAASLLAVLASQSADLAAEAVTCGALPSLSKALGSSEPALCRAAAVAMTEIASRSDELARSAADAGCVPACVNGIKTVSVATASPEELKLSRLLLCCLGRVAKAGADLAAAVAVHSALPEAARLLSSTDVAVGRFAAGLLKDVASQGSQLAVEVAGCLPEGECVARLVGFASKAEGVEA
jgi:hypothetical protein